MAGLYIHIPFCKQACSYCDFYFVTRKQLIEPFTEALLREIEHQKNSAFAEETIKTIYLGGGTPSLLTPRQLDKIFSSLHNTFNIDADEVTIELNPDDVTAAYLNKLRSLGITRASMGVQSFQPELLTFMHRAHNPEEAIRALETIRDTGFPDFTADLIYGNPGQTREMLRTDIHTLLAFKPPHISAYSLTVEPETRLGRQVALGRISPPDDEIVSAHFDLLANELESADLRQYEVSNFSLPGREAVHNSNYWNHHNYLGLGPAAHSFRRDGDIAWRWTNKPDIKKYLTGNPGACRDEPEQLSRFTLAEERLMLGLRTKWGVDENRLFEEYAYLFSGSQQQWIQTQAANNMLTFRNGLLKMTREGLKICDLLIVDLLSRY